jgi:hypothetical protein
MMEKGRHESLRRKLINPSMDSMKDISIQIVEIGEKFPIDLLSLYIKNIRNGLYPDRSELLKVVIALRNKEMYLACKTDLVKGSDNLINLLKANIPDPEIEQLLVAELVRSNNNNDYPTRRAIIESLRDYGSIGCLDDLYAIEFDYDPKFKTDRSIQKGLNGSNIEPEYKDFDSLTESERETLGRNKINNLVRSLDISFGELLKEAIKVIAERNKIPNFDWCGPESSTSIYLQGYNTAITKAKQKYREDFSVALNSIRQSLEALLKHIAFVNNLKQQPELDSLLLTQIITVIRDAKLGIPKPIFDQIDHIRAVSNIGSHNQGSFSLKDTFSEASILGHIETVEMMKDHCIKSNSYIK